MMTETIPYASPDEIRERLAEHLRYFSTKEIREMKISLEPIPSSSFCWVVCEFVDDDGLPSRSKLWRIYSGRNRVELLTTLGRVLDDLVRRYAPLGE